MKRNEVLGVLCILAILILPTYQYYSAEINTGDHHGARKTEIYGNNNFLKYVLGVKTIQSYYIDRDETDDSYYEECGTTIETPAWMQALGITSRVSYWNKDRGDNYLPKLDSPSYDVAVVVTLRWIIKLLIAGTLIFISNKLDPPKKEVPKKI